MAYTSLNIGLSIIICDYYWRCISITVHLRRSASCFTRNTAENKGAV